jgi:outer membrane protein assembly factor BamE (lipoprotein component of BamABCDE complex)
MKAPKMIFVIAAALGVLLAAGCSTPETRIKKSPEAFGRLTPAQQDMIRKGEVGLGFDQEMVQLALGEPDRIRTRTDAEGTSEVWAYTTWETYDGMPLYTGWYHRRWGWGDPFYPYYMSYPARAEHEHLRVTFKAGKVTAVEQETRW